jgi:7-keto-8-aminopelargonate synthetase-like enzyme
MSLSLALPHGGPRLVANARVDAVTSGSEVETDGSRLLNASADDVLGLSTDARVKDAASTAIKRFGVELTRSSTLVVQLESRLAATLRADSAALVDSIATVLRALEQADAKRFVDARLSLRLATKGTVFTSPEQLALQLAQPGSDQRIVLVDGVRVYEGDLAPLPRLIEIAHRNHVPIVVIDALGPGPLGAEGTGVLEHFELAGQVDLSVSALGPGTVAIAGVRAVVEAFLPFLPSRVGAGSTAAITKRLELIQAEPHRRTRSLDLAQSLHEALRAHAFDTGPSVTPIVPLWLGDEGLTDIWLRQLAEYGVFCRGLLDGPRSRLLLALPATSTHAQMLLLVEALEKTARALGAPPPLGADATRSVTIARPGSFVIATPCHARWLPSTHESPGNAAPLNDGRSMRERLFDTVETLTWRIASGQSGQLRTLPGADRLRTLLDRARPRSR